jgi:hypothetical protein
MSNIVVFLVENGTLPSIRLTNPTDERITEILQHYQENQCDVKMLIGSNLNDLTQRVTSKL